MNILVINCGSSSLKFSVVDTETGRALASGIFDKLGSEQPTARLNPHGADLGREDTMPAKADNRAALEALSRFLHEPANQSLDIKAVGHRVVHGGEHFRAASEITADTLAAIDACNDLAPLHNPANAEGIRMALQYFPELPQVAVFDTAFHQTLDRETYLYPLPQHLHRDHGVRRYGFHGTSHKYVCHEASRILDKPLDQVRLITVHLGNGCSATAIQNGRSVDTTMGLTPLEGLVMGTRSGSIDPGIIFHLHRSLGMTINAIDDLLNKRSGLLGISGSSNDMRTLRQQADGGDESAALAIRIFNRRLAKAIAALRCEIDGLDAIVFTGGIGENDARTRAETVDRLGFLGVDLDPVANRTGGNDTGGVISTPTSASKLLVIRTNEELMIAREAKQTLTCRK